MTDPVDRLHHSAQYAPMSIGVTPSDTTTPAPGGAIGTPTSKPVFVTTTSICTGHETSGLCARVSTTTEAHTLPSTGVGVGMPLAGSGLLLAGVLAVFAARRRTV